jgi:hypothetical protein
MLRTVWQPFFASRAQLLFPINRIVISANRPSGYNSVVFFALFLGLHF